MSLERNGVAKRTRDLRERAAWRMLGTVTGRVETGCRDMGIEPHANTVDPSANEDPNGKPPRVVDARSCQPGGEEQPHSI